MSFSDELGKAHQSELMKEAQLIEDDWNFFLSEVLAYIKKCCLEVAKESDSHEATIDFRDYLGSTEKRSKVFFDQRISK